MPALRIALVQMRCPKGHIARNLAEISRPIRQSGRQAVHHQVVAAGGGLAGCYRKINVAPG